MILITSADYVNYGLASEFGRIPPCMLPVQNKRLYEHQYNLINSLFDKLGFKDDIYLSLPSSYKLPEFDKSLLDKLNIKVIYIKPDISLLYSINSALAYINKYNEPLRILFGDTLFKSLPIDSDIYLYGKSEDDYKWDYSDRINVYSGFFSFSDQYRLRAIMTAADNFTDAIEKYGLSGVSSYFWLDFGLQNTYYRSISKFTTQREFNSLEINRFSVIKHSKDFNKMNAESNWFLNVPSDMKKFVPAVWNKTKDSYEIEYFYLSSIANLYVYGELSYSTWVNIINACDLFLKTESMHIPENIIYIAILNNKLFTEKTRSRILKYANCENIDLNHSILLNGIQIPSINEIIDELDKDIIKDSNDNVTIMHGDFCFSNILYDFKSQSIKVIDPRGISADGKEQTIFGDLRYDIAKLAHSIIGKYDFIIAGRFSYIEKAPYDIEFYIYDNDNCKIIDYFLLMIEHHYNISSKTIYPIMINLFLSMLPLHNDNKLRQKALFANALRLYLEYKSL